MYIYIYVYIQIIVLYPDSLYSIDLYSPNFRGCLGSHAETRSSHPKQLLVLVHILVNIDEYSVYM